MSELPPAGWHPDPHGSGLLRYWDGAAWTEHLHAPVTPAAPVAPNAPVAPQAPAPAIITLGRKKEPVLSDGQVLTHKGKAVALAHLVSVAHSITDRFVNGVYSGTSYRLELVDARNQKLVLAWTGRTSPKKRQAGQRGEADVAFERLLEHVYDTAVDLLLDRMVNAIEAGGSVQIGRFVLRGPGLSGSKGLTGKAFEVPWRAVAAASARGAVDVTTQSADGKRVRLGSVPLGTPNGPLLRPLVRHFGGAV